MEKSWPKIYLGQDPHPDVFESRMRIRSKIVRIRNTGFHGFFWRANPESLKPMVTLCFNIVES
jgi:hypothetical protein